MCVCVCLSLVKTSAYGFGTRSLAILEKNEKEGKKNHGKKLERVWFDAQNGNPHTDVFVCVCMCLCMCVFVLVAVRVCCHAYACMGTHMDARRNVV